MKNNILAAGLLGIIMVASTACYNNKVDILATPKVSFRKEIVPIMTSGACGCHNNGVGTRAVQFSYLNNIYYDAILARVQVYKDWINGGKHPGEGTVDFSANEKVLISKWIAEGAIDDYEAPPVTGNVTYTTHILPIYNTSCKGASCHGGAGPALDYAGLVADKSILSAMVNSGGATGHPGGTVSLTASTLNTLQAWLDQGMPQ